MAGLSSAGKAGVAQEARPLFPDIGEAELRTLTWNACGILRSGLELEAAYKKLANQTLQAVNDADRLRHEIRNMYQVGLLITQAALGRTESRGGHYRIDFPAKSPAFDKHSMLQKADGPEAQLAFT